MPASLKRGHSSVCLYGHLSGGAVRLRLRIRVATHSHPHLIDPSPSSYDYWCVVFLLVDAFGIRGKGAPVTETVSTLPVREVMTKEPLAVSRDMSIGELVILFDHHDYNGFPVVDEEGVLAGIVTKLDLLGLLRPDDTQEVPGLASVSQFPVERIMRHGIITVEPEDAIAAVADLMVETRLRSIPVVQRHSGKPVLVGIVSRNDLLRRLLTEARAASP